MFLIRSTYRYKGIYKFERVEVKKKRTYIMC